MQHKTTTKIKYSFRDGTEHSIEREVPAMHHKETHVFSEQIVMSSFGKNYFEFNGVYYPYSELTKITIVK